MIVMEKNNNNRRITKEQKFMLVQYLEEHTEFSHDRFANDTGAKSLQEQWNKLAESLNACGGALKDGEGWKRTWVNMRSKAKQKSQDLRNALERSGVNSSVADKRLTDLDERIIAVMNTVAIVGQTQVGEPLRSSGAVDSVEIFSTVEEFCEIEFLDESAGPSRVAPRETGENRENQPPPQPRAQKRKNCSLEETNAKMISLEERRLAFTERKVKALERRNCIEERKADAIDRNNNLLSNVLNKLDEWLNN